ncbi:hypothetical protein SAMN04488541_100158 [Thermoflexibacter ruber]|uniref:Oxygen tolerance n=2 Tax=Thermoflexibacter ruber TaxID=1003 RepID=A0A1I2A7A3_9BACT|nr:hypothetical protein SAMN04488541_100158 [Thermoflexibacter ruber]
MRYFGARNMSLPFHIVLVCILAWVCLCPAKAQNTAQQQAIQRQITLKGSFLPAQPDAKAKPISVKVGEYIDYELVVKYPENMELRFPDSSYNYAPFEFIKKRYFPTVTKDKISTDSTIYQLATYQTDSIQSLTLPIYVLTNGDTTLIYTNTDSVIIKPLIVTLSDTVKLISNTNYNAVERLINYPYIIIGVGILVVLALALYLIFGERIRKAYYLSRLKRNHERFATQFEKYLQNTLDNKQTEKGLGIWKSYLENLQDIPYTTYTSKEIEEKIHDKDLTLSLRHLDRAIYGNMIDESIKPALNFLFQYAQKAYQLKIEEVKNA